MYLGSRELSLDDINTLFLGGIQQYSIRTVEVLNLTTKQYLNHFNS